MDKINQTSSRIGLHYFSDSYHYRETDLQTWQPILSKLGVSWLVLEAETGRAIPEEFITGMVKAGIQPILHFRPPLDPAPAPRDLYTLMEVYARWGVKQVIFFDRPNTRSAWPAAGWAQQDLVERFMDRYLPLADLTCYLGMTPVFPPLEPGGSYWDTAFLRTSLQAILRRKHEHLADALSLSAYAWSGAQSLDYGAGGPERWPLSRPYHTPEGSQDQRGFRIFDWYQAVTRSVLRQERPMFLLQAGYDPQASAEMQLQTTSTLASLLAGETVMDSLNPQNQLDPIDEHVRAAAFWLLASPANQPAQISAWFNEDASPRAIAEAILARKKAPAAADAKNTSQPAKQHPIQHYLLLPSYDWGISDWHLEAVRPYLRKYRPALGFSLQEAALAERVTVIGDEQDYPPEALEHLRQSGCMVERIEGDGTRIATTMAER